MECRREGKVPTFRVQREFIGVSVCILPAGNGWKLRVWGGAPGTLQSMLHTYSYLQATDTIHALLRHPSYEYLRLNEREGCEARASSKHYRGKVNERLLPSHFLFFFSFLPSPVPSLTSHLLCLVHIYIYLPAPSSSSPSLALVLFSYMRSGLSPVSQCSVFCLDTNPNHQFVHRYTTDRPEKEKKKKKRCSPRTVRVCISRPRQAFFAFLSRGGGQLWSAYDNLGNIEGIKSIPTLTPSPPQETAARVSKNSLLSISIHSTPPSPISHLTKTYKSQPRDQSS